MKKITKPWFLLLVALLLFAFLVIRPYYNFVTKTLSVSPVRALLSNDSLKSYDNQVNILFLGIAGQDHDGPNLSDSITVININLKTGKVMTISIPRDIWSDTLKDKINSAYAYGEAKKPGGGFILAKAEISEIVGMPIQYGAAIDFGKFEELIDFLGGVDVNVERTFTDKKFPIKGRENDNCNGDPEYGCRYETITFTKGRTMMNGETALKFVRSRYSEGPEGTDFAREARQQKVMTAVKNKITDYVKFPNVKKYTTLYELFNKIIKRDITNQQAAIIARSLILKGKPSLESFSLGEDFFENPDISERYDYHWVLIPKSNNFGNIHEFIKCRLSGKNKCP